MSELKNKKITSNLLDLSAMVFVLEKALGNQYEEITDALPYADMAKIIRKKVHKIMSIFFG